MRLKEAAEPRVTVLTPVYNGERYLAECIESVLKQNYSNWEYVIVNNSSTDSSLDIASRYASLDSRIRVINNTKFVEVIENHNIAFGYVTDESQYCKVVSADDWIEPYCLEQMVRVGEAYPSVGIVGSYQIAGGIVRWKGLPSNIEFFSGREVVRLCLLRNLAVFGNPTSELYRSALIREHAPFFPHLRPYADITACYKYLSKWDFGFVHKVISTERLHENRVSSKLGKLQIDSIVMLESFLQFGPQYLTREEFEQERILRIEAFHRWLGGCLLKMNGIEFWKYQIGELKELGCPIKWTAVLKGAVEEIIEEIRRPGIASRKLLETLARRLGLRKNDPR